MSIKLVKVDQVTDQQLFIFKKSFLQEKELIHGSSGLTTAPDIKKWRKQVTKKELKPLKNQTKVTQFMAVDELNNLVGVASVNHQLTGQLQLNGGHIAYSVSKLYRGKGYGKQILKEVLFFSKIELQHSHVLLTCESNNNFSRTVILSSGGILESRIQINQTNIERYWINLNKNNTL
ncbi:MULTISPECIES: GNAT family N-acetyltransferase [Vagococcus]|uniref:Acetyltransferase n=1 Tax=Vagococcus fluvialis bH819 TaxID=1255619 RepID=A0A1X6WNG1_9ENTE|nr:MULTISPECIES: GNAT family N-acetyltransferase [Vagococcus]SLM85809.1 Acetyltransferase [Vagococcus fluvialis bH819]HCM90231.1 GNAT family N-acetyltransferase [Vagococcus sp.]